MFLPVLGVVLVVSPILYLLGVLLMNYGSEGVYQIKRFACLVLVCTVLIIIGLELLYRSGVLGG